MTIKRTPLPKFRHEATVVKTGWFKEEIVLILQQKYHITDEYHSPDVSGQYYPLHIDRYEWQNCKTLDVKIEDFI